MLTTHELHIAGLAYQVVYAVNLQGDTKLRQVKFQLGCLHLPPLNPDSLGCQSSKGFGVGNSLVMGIAAMVGPADGQGEGFTSSQSE